MTASQHDYKQWPFLDQEEFDLACAFFDQRHRRALTTNTSFLEILRLLQLPDNDNGLSDIFGKMGGDLLSSKDVEMEEIEDGDQEVLRVLSSANDGAPPPYNPYSLQPYVTYEVHLHPTYRVPTLWFTLHDLPMGEATFNIEAVYRYLVPDEYKSKMRTTGVMGGLSAAPHPLTDVPSFFVHPCQTPDALKPFECALEDYIIVWIGLVGRCIGLTIPLEMAKQDMLS